VSGEARANQRILSENQKSLLNSVVKLLVKITQKYVVKGLNSIEVLPLGASTKERRFLTCWSLIPKFLAARNSLQRLIFINLLIASAFSKSFRGSW